MLTFWAAPVLLALAVLLLSWNVRPRLRGSGFTSYESMTDTDAARRTVDVTALNQVLAMYPSVDDALITTLNTDLNLDAVEP